MTCFNSITAVGTSYTCVLCCKQGESPRMQLLQECLLI